jgi:DNA-binding PadR family transcriptional regulator
MNPFVGLVLSKGGGLLPLYVLHLLSREPRYGNDIMKELERRSGGTWASNPGAVYPLLRMLERHGLLTGAWEDTDKRTRRIYRLTKQGRREYRELLQMMEPGLKEALRVMQSLYQELYPVRQPTAPVAPTPYGASRGE